MKQCGEIVMVSVDNCKGGWDVVVALLKIKSVKTERLLLWRGPRGREQESCKAWHAPSTTRTTKVAMLQTQVLAEKIGDPSGLLR